MTSKERGLAANVRVWFDQISESIQLPSQEEQRTLHQRYLNGDPDAKEQLLMKNMILISKAVNEIERPDYLEHLDMVHFGVVGMMIAIEKYDPTKNDNFSYYAAVCIFTALKYFMRSYDNQFKLDAKLLVEHKKFIRHQQRLTQELGHVPSEEEYASNLGISLKRVSELLEVDWKRPMSISEMMEQESEQSLEDRIVSHASFNKEENVNYLFLKDAVQKLLVRAKLTDFQKEVISLSFGLEDGIEKTGAEIAKIYGCSASCINDTIQRGMQKLKKVMERPRRNEEYHEYLNLERSDIDAVHWINAYPIEQCNLPTEGRLFYETIYDVLQNQPKESVDYILSLLESNEIDNLKLSYGPDGVLLKNRSSMTLEQQEKRKQIYRKMKELMFLLNHKGIEALKEFSEVQHEENNMGKRRCV